MTTLTLPDDLIDKAIEVWNNKYPFDKQDIKKQIVRSILLEFIKNNNNKKVNKNGQENTS